MSTADQSILDRLRRAKTKREPKKIESPRRNAPLKNSDMTYKKIGKPKGRSEKMRAIFAALVPLYKKFLSTRPICGIKSPVCSGQSTCVHHAEGRGIKKIMDESTWIESCDACNLYVEEHDQWAQEYGFKKSRHAKNQG